MDHYQPKHNNISDLLDHELSEDIKLIQHLRIKLAREALKDPEKVASTLVRNGHLSPESSIDMLEIKMWALQTLVETEQKIESEITLADLNLYLDLLLKCKDQP